MGRKKSAKAGGMAKLRPDRKRGSGLAVTLPEDDDLQLNSSGDEENDFVAFDRKATKQDVDEEVFDLGSDNSGEGSSSDDDSSEAEAEDVSSKSKGSKGQQVIDSDDDDDDDDSDDGSVSSASTASSVSSNSSGSVPMKKTNAKKSTTKAEAPVMDSDNESEGSDGGDSVSGDEDDYEELANLKRLAQDLPPALRQKVLLGQPINEEDAFDDDDLVDKKRLAKEQGLSWGKKRDYYASDTADLEIGQSVEDAYEEEEAALELQRDRLEGMGEQDFFDDIDNGMDSGSDEEGENQKQSKKSKNSSKSKARDGTIGSLESIILKGASKKQSKNDVSIEKIERDSSKMTKKQKLELLAVDSPELLGIVDEVRTMNTELNDVVIPLHDFLVDSDYGETSEGHELQEFLRCKRNLLQSYCTNVLFLMLLKSEGENIRSHPVMRQLLEHVYALRKIKALDKSFAHHYDSLLEKMTSTRDEGEANSDDDSGDQEEARRNKTSSGSSEEEEEDEDEDEEEERFNRLDNQDSDVSETEAPGNEDAWSDEDDNEDEEDLESEEDFNSKATGYGKDKRASKIDKTKSKMMKKTVKEFSKAFTNEKLKTRMTGVDDIIPENDGESLRQRRKNELDKLRQEYKGGFGNVDELESDDEEEEGDGDEQQDAIRKFREALQGLKTPGMGSIGGNQNDDYSDNEDDAEDDPEEIDDDDDDDNDNDMQEEGMQEEEEVIEPANTKKRKGGNLMEKFASVKQGFIAKKAMHYRPAPRFGGIEQFVDEGEKRGISYEMLKNKGLAPHRKKINRNPRVKKKIAYQKALVARKGQVREVITGMGDNYGGEATGIKSNISKSRRIKT